MNVIYRNAERSDIGEIYSIEQICFRQPWSLESLYTDICENDISFYLVAETDGAVAGYCGVHMIDDEGHIMNVAVRPEYRKRGIGQGLLENMMAMTNLLRYTLEVRESNETAIRLYRKLGFAVLGKRPKYYGDEDALIMWK